NPQPPKGRCPLLPEQRAGRQGRGRLQRKAGRVHFAAMPAVAETLIARLEADCTAAEQAERIVRAEIAPRLREAERARAFAWRRLNVLKDMLRAATSEPDRAVAVEHQLVGLFRDIGWIENGLDELGPSAGPLLDRLRPIAEALHGACYPQDANKPVTVGAAFDALE